MYTNERSRKSIVLCQKYSDYRLMYVYKWKVKKEHCIMPENASITEKCMYVQWQVKDMGQGILQEYVGLGHNYSQFSLANNCEVSKNLCSTSTSSCVTNKAKWIARFQWTIALDVVCTVHILSWDFRLQVFSSNSFEIRIWGHTGESVRKTLIRKFF